MKENKTKGLKYNGQWSRYDLWGEMIHLLTTPISVNARDGFYKETGMVAFEEEIILTGAHQHKENSKWKYPWQQRVEP